MGEHDCCYPNPPSSLCQNLSPQSAPRQAENSLPLKGHCRPPPHPPTPPGSVAGLTRTSVPQKDEVAGLSLDNN